MKIILRSRDILDSFRRKHSMSRGPFIRWENQISEADLDTPMDFIDLFSYADLLGAGSNRIVFNIGGNKYRLLCEYNFEKHIIRMDVIWIGTHSDYTELCKTGKQYLQ